MRQEIEEWARASGSPTLILGVTIAAIVAPLAIETVNAVSDASPGMREWDDRLFDRITGPAGATILSVVVLVVAYKLLVMFATFIMNESRQKDENLKTLAEALKALAGKKED